MGQADATRRLSNRRFWIWLGGLLLLAAVVAVGMGFFKDGRTAPSLEVTLLAPEQATPGLPTQLKVLTRDGKTNQAVPGAAVKVVVTDSDGRTIWSGDATTDEHGVVQVVAEIPEDARAGSCRVHAEASSGQGSVEVENSFELKRDFKIYVSTDKPLYQPGQLIHIRGLALATADLRPVGDQEALILVMDPKGNKVFKKKLMTSAFGLVSTDFQLADMIGLGPYRISVELGDTSSEQVVTVKRYALPKFKVTVDADKRFFAPGEIAEGTLEARYTFGEPVTRARVELVAMEAVETLKPFATLSGTTDAEGRWAFKLPLKQYFVGQDLKQGDGMIALQATVTDPAGQKQTRTLDLTVTTRPLRVELFPESGKLVAGVENRVFVLTAYPDGRPAQTTVTVSGVEESLETSSAGIARFAITPSGGVESRTVVAVDKQGQKATVTRQLQPDAAAQGILLRLDRAIYRTGDTAQVTLFSPGDGGRLFLDVIKERRTALTRALTIENGKAELALDLPPELFGTLELHAYRILPDGNIAGDTRVIQVARASDLTIAASLAQERYRPAEKALLQLAVTRSSTKQPVQAALSLAGVDEAVFALHEARPGLEQVYFAIQEEILKPRYQLAARPGVNIAEAVQSSEAMPPEQQQATAALFTTFEGKGVPNARPGERFAARQQRFEEEAREHWLLVRGALPFIPALLFGLFGLVVLGYGFKRLFRRRPLAGLTNEDQLKIKRSVRGALVWLVLGFGLPVGTATLGLWIAHELHMHHEEWGLLAGLYLMALFCLWRLRKRTRTYASVEATRQAPLFWRLMNLLPAAYIMLLLVVALGFVAAEVHPRAVDEDAVIGVLILACLMTVLMLGSFSAIGRSLQERTSTGRYLWLSLSRPGFFIVPVLIFGLGMTFAPGAMRMDRMEMAAPINALQDIDEDIARPAMRAGGMAKMAMAEMAPPGAKDEMKKGGKAEGGGSGGKELKQPTRIRRFFPETLLWLPEVVTDEQGQAEIEIPLADSITTWRLGMSAVSREGYLGAAQKQLVVFQDFFVDIDFPAALTQHDRVSVPVALYNYLDVPQTVRLEVQKEPWFRLHGPGVYSQMLGPREVSGVQLSVEALTPGRHTLTVKAAGTELADAVARQVRVEPDGELQEVAFSGRLEGTIAQNIVIPGNAVSGASRILVRLYPGVFSQVVEGMESLLRLPGG